MHPLQFAAGVVRPALEVATGRAGQVVIGDSVLPTAVEFSSDGGFDRQPLRTEPYQCVRGQPWACHGALQGKMKTLQCSAGVVEPALGAAAGLGRWFGRVAFLPVSGVFLQ